MARKYDFSRWSNEMLQTGWEHGFTDRVKSGHYKGCITVRARKLGDAILAESEKRGVALQTPAKYQ